MTVDVLAIAAHPDDVELTCGGTLIKMAKQGYKTGVLDLTAGEMGTRGTAGNARARSRHRLENHGPQLARRPRRCPIPT